MILVTGATGTVGGAVAARLCGAGVAVRALTRDPSRAHLPDGVEVARGDLQDRGTLTEPLDGVDRVFLVSVGDVASSDRNLVEAAKGTGVRHIVKLSVIGAQDRRHGMRSPARGHVEGEVAIEDSGLAWTFLRPGTFMTNALGWAESVRERDTVHAPFGHVPSAPIDPEDIAAVAVRALTEDGHHGRGYPLSGPEVLTPAEQVDRLASAIGRPLRFVPVPDEAIRQKMLGSGMPEEQVAALFDDLGNPRGAATVWPTVSEVTSAPPRAFDEWLADNLGAFMPRER
ncbi:MAG: NAD(P)H-binding protein [Kutzneria sp.]|nr:NAD(P)H-binding protein [Kutzneria sp.]